MKSIRFALSLVFVASLSALACSGDEEEEEGDGGGGGTSGSSNGGSSGSSGSSSGGSATGGSATGGSATGGASGSATGGSATGGSSTGGSGGQIICPETQPMDESPCDPETAPGFLDDPCEYPEFDCICGFGEEWSCTTCPESAPANGSPCDGTIMNLCQFGLTYCDCTGSDTWQCVGP
ncbi:MAG TPA: hypothetical protein VFZ53_18750 [Polyangiaceae bacterium]